MDEEKKKSIMEREEKFPVSTDCADTLQDDIALISLSFTKNSLAYFFVGRTFLFCCLFWFLISMNYCLLILKK